jgi:hypothetical protein
MQASKPIDAQVSQILEPGHSGLSCCCLGGLLLEVNGLAAVGCKKKLNARKLRM